MATVSWATNAGVARSMRSNRRRDTGPELMVRRALFALGHRYRVDVAPGRNRRRRADIVFTRARLAVYIDGCFWHGCPLHATYPRTNADYWGPKLVRNIERDRETDADLRQQGWTVVRFWEHEDSAAVATRIDHLLRSIWDSANGRAGFTSNQTRN